MKIAIDPNLKKLEFWAVGKEIPKVIGGSEKKYGPETLIHTFRDPKLLVDNAAIARLSSTERDLIIRLLEFPSRTFEYDGVELTWSDVDYPNAWSPSIDTILFAKALRILLRSRHYAERVNSFLEIGCGSGFLSKYILQKKRESGAPIKFARLIDIRRDALSCAMDNIEPVRGNTLISYSLSSPNRGIRVVHPYDLVVCNPPYIPRPHARTNNPFEGLFLYGEILRRRSEMLSSDGRLIINFSSMSKEEVLPEFKKFFSLRSLFRLRVPLKIPLITARRSDESRAWTDYLEKNKKIIVDSTERSGYRYWQNIEIVECKRK